MSSTKERSPPPSTDGSAKMLTSLNVVFLVSIFLALISSLACSTGLLQLATTLIWAFACLAIGALIGSLFGIPRMRQRNAKTTDETATSGPRYEPEINNNLIEISDWLTKIIIGVGLVELHAIPTNIRTIIEPLSISLGGAHGVALAIGIVAFFTTAGFLVGYINGRTFLAVMFRASDDRLLEQKIDKLESQVEKAVVDQEVQQAESTIQRQVVSALVASDALSNTQSTGGSSSSPVDSDLLQMAKDYEEIDDPSYSVRVAKKDQATGTIVRYILRKRIPKQAVFAWASEHPSNGPIIAFSSYVLSMPQSGDLPMLLQLAPHATWLHVKFRITLAIRVLAAEGYCEPDDLRQALHILRRFAEHAANRNDSSLTNLTKQVIASLLVKLPPDAW